MLLKSTLVAGFGTGCGGDVGGGSCRILFLLLSFSADYTRTGAAPKRREASHTSLTRFNSARLARRGVGAGREVDTTVMFCADTQDGTDTTSHKT